MRSGRLLRRLVDVHGGSTIDSLPLPVVTLDEVFLVFNARNTPQCSRALAEFHLYGTDVCLHALMSGCSAYVIDFPITHRGEIDVSGDREHSYWRLYNRVDGASVRRGTNGSCFDTFSRRVTRSF